MEHGHLKLAIWLFKFTHSYQDEDRGVDMQDHNHAPQWSLFFLIGHNEDLALQDFILVFPILKEQIGKRKDESNEIEMFNLFLYFPIILFWVNRSTIPVFNHSLNDSQPWKVRLTDKRRI